MNKALATKLERVEQRSRNDRGAVFNNLGHLVDLDLLRDCYLGLDGAKAVGTDGVTKDEYGKNLEANLRHLLVRIRKGSYHPQVSRIREIPKSDGSMRPLAICCFEDKIVQDAVRRVLERIYEPMFMSSSHGFRPGKSSHTALVALSGSLNDWECGAVLEIDLRKYFNTIPHEPLIRLLKLKIADPKFLWLTIKLLKAPILNEEGTEEVNVIGSPQGSILSPLIANIYLHYVLDIWFSWLNDSEYGGGANMVRYADDVVFTFRGLSQAEAFQKQVTQRLGSFGISINPSKTKAVVWGKREAQRRERLGTRMPTFTFLGFLHVWGTSIQRKTGQRFWRVKRRTCPLRLRKKVADIKSYIKKHRHARDLLPRIVRIIRGYLNYFAINDNEKKINQFVQSIRRYLFKYLNRRSQRRSLTWARFSEVLEFVGFPKAKVLHNLFFDSRSYKGCR